MSSKKDLINNLKRLLTIRANRERLRQDALYDYDLIANRRVDASIPEIKRAITHVETGLSSYQRAQQRANERRENEIFANELRGFNVEDEGIAQVANPNAIDRMQRNRNISRAIDEDDIVLNGFDLYSENILKYKNELKERVRLMLERNQKIKCMISINVVFYNHVSDRKVNIMINYNKGKLTLLQTVNDINIMFEHYKIKWDNGYKYATEKMIGSGWSQYKCKKFYIKAYKTKAIRVGSFIESPDWVGKGVINIKNTDDKCFKYVMDFHKSNKTKHDTEFIRIKNKSDQFNYDGLNFPVDINDLKIFENNNKEVSINVFEVIDNKMDSIYMSKNKSDDVCNLLLLRDGENFHYTYIKKIGNVICEKYLQKSRHQTVCVKCGMSYYSGKECKVHICQDAEIETKVIFDGNKKIEFKNIHKMMKKAFVSYCDFEATLKKIHRDDGKTEKHEINSYCFKTICSFDEKYNSELTLYRGENAVDHYLNAMQQEQKRIHYIIRKVRKQYKMHNLTQNEEKTFIESTNCYICDIKFDENTKKVREHCHYTGIYRGASCNTCNLQLKDNYEREDRECKLTCVFHNLNYDGNFILSEASKHLDKEIKYFDKDMNEMVTKTMKEKLKIIATSEEKFMQIEIGNLLFIDSYKFLSEKLEKLADGLKNEKGDVFGNFIYMKEYFNENLKYACRKGVYPYEWVGSVDKFNVKEFPDHKSFYSRVSCSNVKKDDYEWGKNMYYNILKCKNFGEYHDFYLKCDVLLLTDIFENFRKLSAVHFKLDPVQYISLPSMSYDALLRNMKDNKFYMMQIDCEEKRKFYEEHKIGAICQVMAKKHVKANNKYMASYNKNIVSSYILYTDANNLYAVAMMQALPYEFIEKIFNLTVEDIMNTEDDAPEGYTVCCDISYPQDVHDKLNGYVPGAVIRSVDETEISSFQKEVRGKHKHDKSAKVICDLNEKKEYKADYRLLKAFVKLGVKIDKIHFAYKFKQAKILENYINVNTKARKTSKNDFEKDFYKLCNNAIYGKMLQDVMKQKNVIIETDHDKAIHHFSKPTFSGVASYNNGLYQIQMDKEKVNFNRATYIGTTILDLSKLHMLNLHYNKMLKIWTDIELLYTDTDSLVYLIKSDDVYQDMYDNKELFDLSEVKLTQFADTTNNKVVGKLKDETKMIPIIEWCALKPKLYSFLIEGDDKKHIKCKGITKGVTQKDLNHDLFVNCKETNKEETKKQCRIQTFQRHVYTIVQDKVALSNYDDKMYRYDNDNAYSYGHYKIN